VKPLGRGGQGDQRLDDAAHPCLVEVNATNEGLADLCGERELLEHFVRDEALIDAALETPDPCGHRRRRPGFDCIRFGSKIVAFALFI
jgi:hypothetical protein